MACGTRKDFFLFWGLSCFCNCLISLEVLHKQVMVTTIQIVPTLHFGQDCALDMIKLIESDTDFSVCMNYSTATVT